MDSLLKLEELVILLIIALPGKIAKMDLDIIIGTEKIKMVSLLILIQQVGIMEILMFFLENMTLKMESN